MYRITGRDLSLLLFDNNHLPVRDAAGRLIVRQNAWGAVDTVTFDASDTRWIEVVNTGTCALIDLAAIPKDVKLSAGAPGLVLDPDVLYEACLTPMLLHETFAGLAVGATAGPGGTLGRWQVVDQGTAQGPSHWQVAETAAPVTRYVTQTTNIWGGTVDGTDPVKPGSMLILGPDARLDATHPDQPRLWTDYRLTAYLRNEDDDAIGVVFRYADAGNYYRFAMDAERSIPPARPVVNGVHRSSPRTIVATGPTSTTPSRWRPSGRRCACTSTARRCCRPTDPSHVAGGIGLYCWASERARFFDITVDDFRVAEPPPVRSAVYRFGFTTSQSRTSPTKCTVSTTESGRLSSSPTRRVDEWVAASSPPGAPPTDGEARAYDAFAGAALGPGADSFPQRLELTGVAHEGRIVAVLCRSAEPFDWSRMALQVLVSPPVAHVAEVAPGPVKLVSVSFAADAPAEEAVSLLTREDVELAGYTIEAFGVPGPVRGGPGADSFVEEFALGGRGVLFEETFGPNALDHYTIVDQGELFAPSAWSSTGGAIVQSSMIGGGALDPADLAKPGTVALVGGVSWDSVRISCRLLSTDDKALGLVFRYRNASNYYRFSTDSERSYRRLVKCVDGQFTLLWEDAEAYSPNVGLRAPDRRLRRSSGRAAGPRGPVRHRRRLAPPRPGGSVFVAEPGSAVPTVAGRLARSRPGLAQTDDDQPRRLVGGGSRGRGRRAVGVDCGGPDGNSSTGPHPRRGDGSGRGAPGRREAMGRIPACGRSAVGRHRRARRAHPLP